MAQFAVPRRSRERSFFRRNSLGIVTLCLFLVFVGGMALVGHSAYNADQHEHGADAISLGAYLREGHVWEALFENWESEFLQMAAYVALTIFLVQKGSAESKDPAGHDRVDSDPRASASDRGAPWPVRRGGIWLVLYENSLLLAFVALFGASMIGHALGGVDSFNADLAEHQQPFVDTWGYFTSSQFWYESFQNWQSEFLAVFSIVVLTVFLRQRGSPESKPVAASNAETDGEPGLGAPAGRER
jgi:hypothetical protein